MSEKHVAGLQSGFLTFVTDTNGLVRSKQNYEKDLMESVRVGMVATNTDLSAPYIKVINDHFKDFTNDPGILHTHAKREAVLKDIIAAFGTTNISEWLFLQNSSQYMTTSHRRLLNDTFDYVCRGIRRKVPLLVTMSIVHPRLAKSDERNITIKDVPYDETITRPVLDVPGFIHMYVRRNPGLDDLLTFAKIVFGEINQDNLVRTV